MLGAILPLTLVDGSISPVHFTITVSFVFDILAIVVVSALPLEPALTVFLVIEVVSDVLVAAGTQLVLLPLALTVLHGLLEIA